MRLRSVVIWTSIRAIYPWMGRSEWTNDRKTKIIWASKKQTGTTCDRRTSFVDKRKANDRRMSDKCDAAWTSGREEKMPVNWVIIIWSSSGHPRPNEEESTGWPRRRFGSSVVNSNDHLLPAYVRRLSSRLVVTSKPRGWGMWTSLFDSLSLLSRFEPEITLFCAARPRRKK